MKRENQGLHWASEFGLGTHGRTPSNGECDLLQDVISLLVQIQRERWGIFSQRINVVLTRAFTTPFSSARSHTLLHAFHIGTVDNKKMLF